MHDIVIYGSRGYLAAMAAACLLFVGGSVYPLIYGYDVPGGDALGEFFRSVTPGIFYMGTLFTLPFVYACYRLLKPTPSVIINREGIIDNASALGAGMIRWEEIKGVFIYQVMGKQFLGITPVDVETVLARQSGIKRFFFRLNKGVATAPFAIPEGGLPMTAEELLAKFQLYRNSLSQDRA
jgi:hypothetical protein